MRDGIITQMLVNDTVILILVGTIGLLLGAMLGAGIAFIVNAREASVAKRDELREALRVWQSQRSGRLTLEVDGRDYRVVDEMTVSQYKRLVYLLENLGQWMDVPTLFTRPVGDVKPAELPGFLEAQPASVATKKDKKEQESQVKPVSTSLTTAFLRMIRPKKPPESDLPLSIAAQVDAILQKKLQNSPLRDMGIRLMEFPERGMVVMVGVDEYEGLVDVPDEEIRKLIQACVAEWEDRQDEARE